MSVRTITRVWEHSKQSSTDLLLLLAMADHADDDGVCWPGIPRLAAKTRTSERQTIRNVEKLAQSGEIFLSRQCGRGHSNLYFITVGLAPDEIIHILQSRFELGLEAIELTKSLASATLKGDTGDRVYQEEKVTPVTQKVTPVTLKGDIAMSPEPLEPSMEPSIKERHKKRPPAIPAVQIFAEVTGKYYLNNTQIKALSDKIGASPAALDKWRGCVTAWQLCGYKLTNIAGMLDWFENGIPTYKNGATQNGQTQATYQNGKAPAGYRAQPGQNATQQSGDLTGTAKQISDAIKSKRRTGGA